MPYVSHTTRTEPCRCIAPFGLPVVPEVYNQKAGESAVVG